MRISDWSSDTCSSDLRVPCGGVRHRDLMGQEMAKVDLNLRDRGERAEIGLLPLRLVRIIGSRADLRGEVANEVDLIPRHQRATKRVNVEPLVRGALQATDIRSEEHNSELQTHMRI